MPIERYFEVFGELSPGLRRRVCQHLISIAQTTEELNPVTLAGRGLFEALRTLNQEILQAPTENSESLRGLQAWRSELLSSVAALYREGALRDPLFSFQETVVVNSRQQLLAEIDRLPSRLQDNIFYHFRQATGIELAEVPPMRFAPLLGQVLGRVARSNYFRVFAEGSEAGLFAPEDFFVSVEHFAEEWGGMRAQAEQGDYSLNLTTNSFATLRALEVLVSEQYSTWGELHPLWESFSQELFRGMGDREQLTLWRDLQRASHLLLRLREEERHPDFRPPLETASERPGLSDAGMVFLMQMPVAIRDAVFGNLEYLNQELLASPTRRVALGLARAVAADQAWSLPEYYAHRGVREASLSTAAQWVREQMLRLYQQDDSRNHSLVSGYYMAIGEQSLESIMVALRQSPRELSSDAVLEIGALDPETSSWNELRFQGREVADVIKQTYFEMLLFGDREGIFDLEALGVEREQLVNYLEEMGLADLSPNFEVTHLDNLAALEGLMVQVHQQWGAFHPMVRGFMEVFPEHGICREQAQHLGALRRELTAYLRSRGQFH